MPSLQPPTISELPMLLRESPRKQYAISRHRLVAVLDHGEHVAQDLGRVELVRQAVVHGHAGVLTQLLDDVLAETAVLDGVVDLTEHAGGVLHRLLVADLRAVGPR